MNIVSSRAIPTINRTVLIVTADQPMIDWIRSLPDWDEDFEAGLLTAESINEDIAAFLIPEFDTPEETIGYIDQIKNYLLEQILSGWTTDKGLWPKNRSRALFDEWFSTQFHTMVYDLEPSEELVREEC